MHGEHVPFTIVRSILTQFAVDVSIFYFHASLCGLIGITCLLQEFEVTAHAASISPALLPTAMPDMNMLNMMGSN
jgi:hypothetical protein